MPGVKRECAVNLAGVAGPRRPHHEHHHRHPTLRRDVRPRAVTAMHRPAGERLGQVHNGAALDAGAAKGAKVYHHKWTEGGVRLGLIRHQIATMLRRAILGYFTPPPIKGGGAS